MKIDLTSLKREKISQVDLNFLLNLDTINYHGDVIIQLSPASVTGKLYVMNDKIFLACEVFTEFQVNCSRCLKSFNYPMDTKINAELVPEDTVEDDDEIDDLVYYQNDIIDLNEVVRENIILQLPMKMLCTENCKGLCSQCGGDLNLHQCECNSAEDEEEEEEVLDPRLAKLRKLLHQD